MHYPFGVWQYSNGYGVMLCNEVLLYFGQKSMIRDGSLSLRLGHSSRPELKGLRFSTEG